MSSSFVCSPFSKSSTPQYKSAGRFVFSRWLRSSTDLHASVFLTVVMLNLSLTQEGRLSSEKIKKITCGFLKCAFLKIT